MDTNRNQEGATEMTETNDIKLAKTTFGPESFQVNGYIVKAGDHELGIVYKRESTHQVMGNGGRSRIAVGTTKSTTWHYQTGPDWGWLRRDDLGYAHTRADAVDQLLTKLFS